MTLIPSVQTIPYSGSCPTVFFIVNNLYDNPILFSSALYLKRSIDSWRHCSILMSWKFKMKDFASYWEKSRMSLTKKSIWFAQFLAILKKTIPPEVRSILFLSKSREATIPLRGFLNSCAAEANAIVLILDSCFYLSISSHWDMSLIVTIL